MANGCGADVDNPVVFDTAYEDHDDYDRDYDNEQLDGTDHECVP